MSLGMVSVYFTSPISFPIKDKALKEGSNTTVKRTCKLYRVASLQNKMFNILF